MAIVGVTQGPGVPATRVLSERLSLVSLANQAVHWCDRCEAAAVAAGRDGLQ